MTVDRDSISWKAEAHRLAQLHIHAQAERDAAIRRADELALSEGRLREALQYVVDCFTAAEVEGVLELLRDTEDADLKDRVERRIYFAKDRAMQELEKQPSTAIIEAMREVCRIVGESKYWKVPAIDEALRKLRELESITTNQEELK